jgi:hypothetical protein
MSQIGTLEDTRIADVLRLLAAGRKTGLLVVAAPKRRAQVHFQKGVVVHAVAGRCRGEEAVLDLFGWKQGQLSFVPKEQAVTPNVIRDVEALVEEGLRLGDSFHRMRQLVPSERVVFQMAPAPDDAEFRCSFGPGAWTVLRLLDGVRDLREVADAARLPRADVMQIAFELADRGLIERLDMLKSLRAQAQGLFGKDPATVDERLDDEWRRALRFAAGVFRVEVRSLAGRTLVVPVSYKPGLIRDIHLQRATLAELAVVEGENVNVRPVA